MCLLRLGYLSNKHSVKLASPGRRSVPAAQHPPPTRPWSCWCHGTRVTPPSCSHSAQGSQTPDSPLKASVVFSTLHTKTRSTSCLQSRSIKSQLFGQRRIKQMQRIQKALILIIASVLGDRSAGQRPQNVRPTASFAAILKLQHASSTANGRAAIDLLDTIETKSWAQKQALN